MNLPETNLSTIVKAVASRPTEAALPSNLDDVILHQIARDLRLMELSCTVDDSIAPPLAGPLYLVLHMMRGESERLKGKLGIQLQEELLQPLLRRYMHYIEREIVSRAIKMPCKLDADDLMSDIQDLVVSRGHT